MSELIPQIKWELDSFLAYINNLNPNPHEKAAELEIMQTLKSSIEHKLDALMEYAQA